MELLEHVYSNAFIGVLLGMCIVTGCLNYLIRRRHDKILGPTPAIQTILDGSLDHLSLMGVFAAVQVIITFAIKVFA